MSFLNHTQNPVFEFHISREMRDFYHVDENLFAQTGNVIFANFFAVRGLADKMNKKRDLDPVPGKNNKSGSVKCNGTRR